MCSSDLEVIRSPGSDPVIGPGEVERVRKWFGPLEGNRESLVPSTRGDISLGDGLLSAEF